MKSYKRVQTQTTFQQGGALKISRMRTFIIASDPPRKDNEFFWSCSTVVAWPSYASNLVECPGRAKLRQWHYSMISASSPPLVLLLLHSHCYPLLAAFVLVQLALHYGRCLHFSSIDRTPCYYCQTSASRLSHSAALFPFTTTPFIQRPSTANTTVV